MGINRRELLKSGAVAAGAFTLVPAFLREALAAPAQAGPGPYGPLGAPDANSLMLPAGFTSRRIAVGGQVLGGTGYTPPRFPDGQATFRTNDGGWILVTNSESRAAEGGGVWATRFSSDGTITNAYRILAETDRNCAGGPTPWGTWLTGEEVNDGMIWECDPAGVVAGSARPALGVFNHEAAAVDPVGRQVYLSEDSPGGGFYRFTPTTYPDLSAGVLEVAQLVGTAVTWHVVPDPTTAQTGTPTQRQVAAMTVFNGGEGLWYAAGVVYFTTKGDKKVWSYTPATQIMEVLYDAALAPGASLDQVDNVTVSAAGDILVCEDGGNLEVGIITPGAAVSPLLRFTGVEHANSELCGVVFDPSHTRLYVTSQRAAATPGAREFGAVYEISGPFVVPAGGPPADLVYGPPLGEPAPVPPPPVAPTPGPGPAPTPTPTPAPALPDTRAPGITVAVRRTIARADLLTRGIEVRVRVDEASSVGVVFNSAALKSVRRKGERVPRPVTVLLARLTRRHPGSRREVVFRLKPSRAARAQLARKRGSVRARILVTARDAAGNDRTVVRTVTIGRRR